MKRLCLLLCLVLLLTVPVSATEVETTASDESVVDLTEAPTEELLEPAAESLAEDEAFTDFVSQVTNLLTLLVIAVALGDGFLLGAMLWRWL